MFLLRMRLGLRWSMNSSILLGTQYRKIDCRPYYMSRVRREYMSSGRPRCMSQAHMVYTKLLYNILQRDKEHMK